MEKISNLVLLLKKYSVESILISVSLIIMVVSAVLYIANVSAAPQKQVSTTKIHENVTQPSPVEDVISSNIIVDITGAVIKPDSYILPSTARLKDALTKAGGLSDFADKDFFYRNFNLARMLSDQQKIYIPSILEVSMGIFKESNRVLDAPSSSDETISPPAEKDEVSSKIHINSASTEQLDSLPAIGVATAQKIIDNRPYSQPDDLVSKKIVGLATFNKIKDLIDL